MVLEGRDFAEGTRGCVIRLVASVLSLFSAGGLVIGMNTGTRMAGSFLRMTGAYIEVIALGINGCAS